MTLKLVCEVLLLCDPGSVLSWEAEGGSGKETLFSISGRSQPASRVGGSQEQLSLGHGWANSSALEMSPLSSPSIVFPMIKSVRLPFLKNQVPVSELINSYKFLYSLRRISGHPGLFGTRFWTAQLKWLYVFQVGAKYKNRPDQRWQVSPWGLTRCGKMAHLPETSNSCEVVGDYSASQTGLCDWIISALSLTGYQGENVTTDPAQHNSLLPVYSHVWREAFRLLAPWRGQLGKTGTDIPGGISSQTDANLKLNVSWNPSSWKGSGILIPNPQPVF